MGHCSAKPLSHRSGCCWICSTFFSLSLFLSLLFILLFPIPFFFFSFISISIFFFRFTDCKQRTQTISDVHTAQYNIVIFLYRHHHRRDLLLVFPLRLIAHHPIHPSILLFKTLFSIDGAVYLEAIDRLKDSI